MDKLDLCDASSLEWEQSWEALFDSAAGEEVAKTREKFASSNQLQEERWEIWDGPSPQQVCSVKSGNPWPKSSPPSSSDFIISDNRGQLAGGTSCLKFFCRLTHSLAVGSPRMLEHLADESRVSNLFMALFATLLRKEMLVWWTLLGVAAGVGVGASLYNSNCSSLTIDLIGYPGELYLRALQQLVLPLVVSSLMSGVFSLRQAGGGLGERTYPLVTLVELCNSVVIKIILGVIAFSPFGVASLACKTLLKACNVFHLLKALGVDVGTVIGGFLLHSLVVLPLTVVLLSQKNPFKLLNSATMPLLTMNVLRLPDVIPVSCALSRYFSLAIFCALIQAHGLELNLNKLFVLAIASTLAAIGCASVPQAGVITAVGFSRYVGDVSVLLAVDWLLGSIRTSVNIWEMAVLA
ncbi:hypothetical protein SELMODRAFT_428676 [Selaginella moellendorffii]|uniref:Amino acid transporter n=1 Tax=Selaginella moellendorffii TaxID=88036 RepID=D8T3P3_SELML|nr:hypothetical protein SELMODRAFT_428676 [Selaginella moellendorffii]